MFFKKIITYSAVLVAIFAFASALFPEASYAQVKTCYEEEYKCTQFGLDIAEPWIESVTTEFPDAVFTVQGIPRQARELVPSEITGGSCVPVGDSFCFANYDNEEMDDLYSDLKNISSSTLYFPPMIEGKEQLSSDDEAPGDPKAGGEVKCYAGSSGFKWCQSMEQLFIDNHGADKITQSCPATKEEGTKSGVVDSYCFITNVDINDDYVCSSTGFGAPVAEFEYKQTKEQKKNEGQAYRECQKKRGEYLIHNDSDSVPACEKKYSLSWDGNYRMCFNASGLIMASENEVEEAERKRLEEEEKARLEEIQEKRDDFNDAVDARFDAQQEANPLVPCMGYYVGGKKEGAECDWNALIQLANNIIDFAIMLASIVLVLIMAFAGFKLITAQGNTEQLKGAKSAMLRAVVGFVIVLTAWLIVDTVMTALLDEEYKSDNISNLLE